MKRVSMMLACAATLFAVQPVLANEGVESELAEMRELMQGLQEKLDAQEEQLSHQGELLEQAQDVVRTQQGEGTKSGLDDFIDSISIGGHIAGSYNYNFNTPKEEDGGKGLNAGTDGPFLPFHQDHNTFTVDQVWFAISKEATEESRAGFGFDILFGQNANFLGQGTDEDGRRENVNDGTSDYYIHQAYVEYLCDCFGPEVNFTFGKFQTMVGAEVAQAPQNFNITRGNVYSMIQPVDHLGLLATTDLGMAELTLGIVNSIGSVDSSPDINNEKGYIFSAKVGDDKMNGRASFLYGAEGQGDTGTVNSPRSGLFDLTAWFNPTENVSMWANYNYAYLESTGYHVNAVALAGRVAVTEKIGASLRGEYLRERGSDDAINLTGVGGQDENREIYSLTGTGDYTLTDNLMMRGEIRFDWIDEGGVGGQGFFKNNNEGDNQTVGLLEVVYSF